MPWNGAFSPGRDHLAVTVYSSWLCRYRRTSNILITEADAAIDPDFHGVVERRMLELGSIFGIQDFLSGWFHGVPFDQILRGNVLDFIAYGFYCKRVENLTPEVCLSLTSVSTHAGMCICHHVGRAVLPFAVPHS